MTSLREALSLRADGITAPILMWLYSPADEMDRALTAGVDVSAGSIPALRALTRAARRTGRPAVVHLKAGTGPSRGGAVAGDDRAADGRADQAGAGRDGRLVFGPGTRGEPTVAEWAAWARTNPHEILTGIGARVERRCPAVTVRAARSPRGARRVPGTAR